MSVKKYLFAIIFLLLAILNTFIFLKVKGLNNKQAPVQTSPTPQTTQQSDKPQIVYTKPDPLDNAVISAANAIEITFNIPLQNVPEFRFRLEPKTDVKVELSSDKKTAKIIPIKPWNLGSGFTLYIQPETKFDGVGEWKQDKTYHFGTIKYTGV